MKLLGMGFVTFAVLLVGGRLWSEQAPIDERVRKCLAQLSSDNRQERETALNSLVATGAPAVPALAEYIEKTGGRPRMYACTALGEMGPAAREAIPTLEKLATTSIGSSSEMLGRTLGRIGSDAQPAVLRLLRSGNTHSFDAACAGAALIDPGASEAIGFLLDQAGKFETRASACKALARIGPGVIPCVVGRIQDCDFTALGMADQILTAIERNITPQLVELLSSENPALQRLALNAIAGHPTDATVIVPAIVDVLKKNIRTAGSVRIKRLDPDESLYGTDEDGDSTVQVKLYNPKDEPVSMSGWSLTNEYKEPRRWMFPEVVIRPHDVLVVYLSGKDRPPTDGRNLHTSFQGDSSLYLFSPNGSPVSERRAHREGGDQSAFLREEWALQDVAAQVLSYFGPEARTAVPSLIEAIQAQPSRDCLYKIGALGSIGADARESVPVLVGILDGEDKASRLEALKSLGRILPYDEALPILVKAASDKDTAIRRAAIEAFDQLLRPTSKRETAPNPEIVIPILVQALHENNEYMQRCSLSALARCGPAAASALPDLLEMMKTDNPNQSEIFEVLATSGAGLPALMEMTKSENHWTRERAFMAFPKAGRAGKSVLPQLLDLLHGPNRRVTAAALDAFGEMGADAKAALPDIMAFLDDRDLLHNVATAVAGIGSGADQVVSKLINALKVARNEQEYVEFLSDLSRLRPECIAALPEILSCMRNLPNVERHGNLIANFGPASVPTVIAAVQQADQPAEWRCALVEGLWPFEPTREEVVSTLISLLKDEKEKVRACTAQKLGHMKEDAAGAIPALVEMEQSDTDITARVMARRALHEIRPAEFPDR